MGYDLSISKFKKKIYEEAKVAYPDLSLDVLYHNFLYLYLYPEEYVIPDGSEAKFVAWSESKSLRDRYKDNITNGGVIIWTMEDVQKEIDYFRELFNNIKIIDIVDEEEPFMELERLVRYYNLIKKIELSDDEILIFEHDW